MRVSMRKVNGESMAAPKYSASSGSDLEKVDATQRSTQHAYSNKEEEPFGDESEDGGTKYRTLSWWRAGILMSAETISLGILSLPSVLAAVGIVAGLILIIGLGVIATYTGYVLGQFKLAYPHIHSMADAGEVLLRPIGMPRVGREVFGTAQIIFYIFLMGSHILTWTIAFDTITDHATCNIVWSVIGLIVLFACDLPRTLKNVSYFAMFSFASIFSAVMITMIAVGVDPTGRGTNATRVTPFASAFLSVTNIIFAYSGHVAFFTFISEFKDPREFSKALYMLQTIDTTLYVIVSIVVYRYTGNQVASPALGSAAGIIPKVAYGIAIPTIIVAGVINGHVATKYVYVRLFRGTKHLSSRSWYSFLVWAGIALTFWVLAWIIAESIPVFNDLLGLISSLFAAWFTYGLSGVFWLFMNYGQYTRNWKKMCLTVVNIGTFFLGAAICGIGLYASGKATHDDAKNGSSWSCTANS